MLTPPRLLTLFLLILIPVVPGRAQWIDGFDGPKIEGWFTMTGDGAAQATLVPQDGFARLTIDATADQHGVWYTLIKRDVSAGLDLAKLRDPVYELRVEARVRSSHAPRRVNFMLNTQRTTDYHEHLREYDLAEPNTWYVISMTTRNFDAGPGDSVFVQLCATDFGPDHYEVDIDYYRADVVRRDEAAPDLGEPLAYHPPVPPVATFSHHAPVTHDSVISTDFPDVNFNDWRVREPAGPARVLTVNGTQWIVLRWDVAAFRGLQADGGGVLELTTSSLALGGRYQAAMGRDLGEEFGKIHVIEILGGDPAWDQETVTYQSLLQGRAYADVFNTQMIIDLELADQPGAPAFFTLPRPVLQRLLDGQSKGLLIRPLGALSGTIYASENPAGHGPVLHFNARKK
ncbi:hypothetical protein Verru16b_01246 [Lacunisphaera limnophila]|uniref:Uncharacterized protein n=1 Tax=Lacunisphaera limnophila TaxID=1838286 RepID=A0A1D8ATF6_9BACT|nr:hypothetical protein [Lacunisphaera limnophila]AOS44185.1 hypothetical protein Verru16b_01246 [Lacunisphaera limnophila]